MGLFMSCMEFNFVLNFIEGYVGYGDNQVFIF